MAENHCLIKSCLLQVVHNEGLVAGFMFTAAANLDMDEFYAKAMNSVATCTKSILPK